MRKRIFICTTFPSCYNLAYLTSQIENFFKENEFEIVDDEKLAEIIIISTCGFDKARKDKSLKIMHDYIKKYASQKKIVVTGCLPKIDEELEKDLRILCIGPKELVKFDEFFKPKIKIEKIKANILNEDVWKEENNKDKAFYIQICQGCMNNCAFCSIKKAKGNVESKEIDEIIKEIKNGLNLGYEKFVFIGDDCGSYGFDIGTDFSELINRIDQIESMFDIQIQYFEPGRLIKLLPKIKKEALKRINTITIPIQSANQRIIKLMNRKYDVSEVIRTIKELKEMSPSTFIRTHIIFCYPSENEEEFANNLEITRFFDETIFFIYSENKNIYSLEDKINIKECEKRLERIKELIKKNKNIKLGYLDSELDLGKNKKKTILLISPPIITPNFYNYLSKNIIKRESPELKNFFNMYHLSNFQPIGLLKISTYLKKKNYNVRLIDCKAEKRETDAYDSILKRTFLRYEDCGNFENEKIKFAMDLCGMTYEDFKKRLEEEPKPDEIYVTSGLTYHNKQVHKIIEICKDVFPDVPVSLGGIYATLCSEEAKKSKADNVHIGHIEEAKYQWASLDILNYKPLYSSIKTTYGCPNRCSYCSVSKLEGHKMNYRDPQDVLEEIKYNIKIHGLRRFIFWESNVLMNYKNHLEKILDLIIKERLDIEIKFPEGFQPNLLTKEIAEKLYKAGVKNIIVPLETSDEDLNKILRRPSNLDDFKRAVGYLKEAGFKRIRCFVLAGLPNQKIEDVIGSIRYVWKIGCKPVIMPYTAVPGSEDFKSIFKDIKDVKYEKLEPLLWPFANENMTVHDLTGLLLVHGLSPLEYAHVMRNNREFLKKIFTDNELNYVLNTLKNR